jgi:hypothetical protein
VLGLGYKETLSEVLARVKSRAVEGPRGPDVLHRIRVRGEWLVTGEVIELELPRNLACAACGGGGCDACGRSGAITLHRRGEPADVVEVTLPVRPAAELEGARPITLRVPELGGLPETGSELPRGVLLLTVVPSAEPDANIRLLRGVPSKGPPASVVDSDELEARPVSEPRRAGSSRAVAIAALLVVIWILLLVWLRFTGRG